MQRRVGLLGATSLVGESLLQSLAVLHVRTVAYTRQPLVERGDGVEWRRLPAAAMAAEEEPIALWVCVAPIWVLPRYFDLLRASGAKRVVALSSTSRFSKQDSADAAERSIVGRLVEGEAQLQEWAERNGIEWVVLRPTLIYGRGRDRNICEMARFIRRFGFFPLFGTACGVRQPVHADDVAAACVAALTSPAAINRAYSISGGETLSYREMVRRVFAALGRPPRLLPLPLPVIALAIRLLHIFPRCRHWTATMAWRMNYDLQFDHADAARDLSYAPRPFRLDMSDLPRRSAR